MILGVGLLVVVIGTSVCFLSEAENPERQEAMRQIEGIGPDEMAEKLFGNEPLPEIVPIEVSGILDLRMILYETEYLAPMMRGEQIEDLTSFKVYGLLHHPSSPVFEKRGSVRHLAVQMSNLNKRYPNVDVDQYNRTMDRLVSAYAKATTGAVIFVELDRYQYRSLYAEIFEDAIAEVNRKQGRTPIPSNRDLELVETNRRLLKGLLDQHHVKRGVFKVQLTRHNYALSQELVAGEFTKNLHVIRTVKQVEESLEVGPAP